ncbi:alpha/beta-hydrolase [Auriculariales sp. MPI-PUGE-AT-0066]|nr:alpha/beta-hydrolase [Auriculariales sp. MPI-PUGE-AT-0066]
MYSLGSLRFSLPALLAFASTTLAVAILPRAKPVVLSRGAVDALTPITFFTAAAACQPSATRNWSCTACRGNPDFQPTSSGGDGGTTQFWYVGFSPSLNTIVVGHQGTDFGEIEAVLTDANIVRDSLDPTLFPGVPSNVKAHGGFLDAHARAAPDVMAAVKQTMNTTGTNNILLASHSLGAALSLLDAVMFKQQLPGVFIRYVGYGLPRVGNQEFADFVDANLPDVIRIVNQQDPVPILPGRFLGFRHPTGEVHIGEDGTFLHCNGQESKEDGCTIDSTRFLFQAEPKDHSGPYNGFQLACSQAPP